MPIPTSTPGEPDRLLVFFAFGHLPPPLHAASEPFHRLAHHIADTWPATPERSVCLRKLLEAKDAAVRCALESSMRTRELAPMVAG